MCMIAWWICKMNMCCFTCGEERACRSTCPSGIVWGGGRGMEGDILWNTVIWPYWCFLYIHAQCSSLRSEVTPVSICSLWGQNEMSNLDTFSLVDISVCCNLSLLQAWYRYYWAIAFLFPFLAEKQIFSCGHMLSWMSKCSQTSSNVKIRPSSAFQGCFNVLLLWSWFCSWSLRPSTTSQTRKLWWVLWKKFKILGKLCSCI